MKIDWMTFVVLSLGVGCPGGGDALGARRSVPVAAAIAPTPQLESAQRQLGFVHTQRDEPVMRVVNEQLLYPKINPATISKLCNQKLSKICTNLLNSSPESVFCCPFSI